MQLADCASHVTGLQTSRTPMCSRHSYIRAGPLNFIFEKAKFTGVVSAQLKEAERQGRSGAYLAQLADELQSEDCCSNINVFNER